MGNKNLIITILIVVLAAVGVIVLLSNSSSQSVEDTKSSNGYYATVTPTETPTPSEISEGNATPTPTVTLSTPTPTPTASTENFDQNLMSNWVYGVTAQTVSGKVYFIDNSSNQTVIKKGSSATDASAETVYTSDGGNVGSFNVLGSSLIIALKRSDTTGESRLIRYYPSGNRTVLLYKYQSSKVEITAFAIPKDSTSEFYLGLNGVGAKYQPMLLYAKQYAQVWINTLDTAKKDDMITAVAPTSDGNSLKVKLLLANGETKIQLFTIPK